MTKRLSKVLLFLFTLSLMLFLYSCYDDDRPSGHHHRRRHDRRHDRHDRDRGDRGIYRGR